MSTHSVEVGVGIFRHVVVEHDIYSFNIHASSKEIGGNQHSLAETLERLVFSQPKETEQCFLVRKAQYCISEKEMVVICLVYGLSPQSLPTRSYGKLQEYTLVYSTNL